MAENPVGEVASEAELKAFCAGRPGLTAVLLWAPWHPPSEHLTKVLVAVAAETPTFGFAKVNTDVCPGIASSLGADQVPFVAFLDKTGVKVDQLAGADPPKLVERVKSLASRPLPAISCGQGGTCQGGTCAQGGSSGVAQSGGEDLNTRLKELINFSPVMLFMKGSKAEPFCKFSKQAIAILEKHNAEYSTFDILKDDEVRQGLKDYSNWKTYPQLYIDGELMGGVDILKEMEEDGSLDTALKGAGGTAAAGKEAPVPLEERLRELINKAPVMLFMKGNPEQPRCGFSGKMVQLLGDNNVEFSTFDILSDEDVRQGLKTYSNWPTFPQLYAKGKLIGGLDIAQELAQEGSLLEELGVENK
mmetsp:Transcript_76855/g.178247  ORF Transcript_76855/g.178247 Transcript_76855/m.178247 type:complete len:360 (+) Transcript_76855:57-1136(+)